MDSCLSKIKVTNNSGFLKVSGDLIQDTAKKYLQYVPSKAQENKILRDGTNTVGDPKFHITLLSPTEYRELSNIQELLLSEDDLFDIGLAHVKKGCCEAWYVVIHSFCLQQYRECLNLPQKDLHITLGFYMSDPHGDPNGSHLIKNITHWNYGFKFIDYFSKSFTNICRHTQPETTTILEEQSQKILKLAASNVIPHLSFINIPTKNQELSLMELSLINYLIYEQKDNQYTPSNYINLAKQLGQIALKKNMHNLATSIGWYLLHSGFLIGIKLVIVSIVQRSKSINLQDIFDLFPIKLSEDLSIGRGKIDAILRNINELIMEFGQNWAYSNSKEVLYYDYEDGYIKKRKLPRNFSWVKLKSPELSDLSNKFRFNYLLAGSAMPSKIEHIEALHAVGIRIVMTIHENPLSNTLINKFGRLGLTPMHSKTQDRTPPALDDLVTFTNKMHHSFSYSNLDETQGVLVHCLGGLGRTNTLIIAYLMRFHPSYEYLCESKTVEEIKDYSGFVNVKRISQSVELQRKMILAASQKGFLKNIWAQHILAEKSLPISSLEAISDPCFSSEEIEVEGTEENVFEKLMKTQKFSPIIMLCGLPGSGKTTLSQYFLKAYPNCFVHINKDMMRGRRECMDAFANALAPYKSQRKNQRKKIIILDGCHISKSKREEWVLAANGLKVDCISFEYPISECKKRAYNRRDHPTVPHGDVAYRVVESMGKMNEPVNHTENFERIIKVKSFRDIKEKVLSPFKIRVLHAIFENDSCGSIESIQNFKPTLPMVTADHEIDLSKPIKFPRTYHALNLGAATRDDKVLPIKELEGWIEKKFSFLIEEKVDGANMGIFIRSQDNRIMVQNRSHFISSEYHAQFKPLDKWISAHSHELYEVLTPDRHILYGEWCYATHSVYYNRLPDYFIAFDIYDLKDKQFLSRSKLVEILCSTTICIVGALYEGPVDSVQQILNLVQGPSHYISKEINKETKGTGKDKKEVSELREGIVIRIIDPDTGFLKFRSKIVRNGFIAGDSRWNNSSTISKNTLANM